MRRDAGRQSAGGRAEGVEAGVELRNGAGGDGAASGIGLAHRGLGGGIEMLRQSGGVCGGIADSGVQAIEVAQCAGKLAIAAFQCGNGGLQRFSIGVRQPFELVDDVGVRLVDVFRRIDQSAYLLIGGADGSGYRAHALVGLCCGLAQQA